MIVPSWRRRPRQRTERFGASRPFSQRMVISPRSP
jgi:hypothetical protein